MPIGQLLEGGGVALMRSNPLAGNTDAWTGVKWVNRFQMLCVVCAL